MKKVAIFSPSPYALPAFVVDAMQWLQDSRLCASTLLSNRSPKGKKTFAHEQLSVFIVLLLRLGGLGRWIAFSLLQKRLQAYDVILIAYPCHRYLTKYRTVTYCRVEKEEEEKRIASSLFNFAQKYKAHFISEITLPLATKVYTKIHIPITYLGVPIPEDLPSTTNPDKHTYFLCVVHHDTYVEDVFYLLRSFSKFKKHTRTSLKLMLCFEDKTMIDKCKLDTYHYGSEVIVHSDTTVNNVNVLSALAMDAYALIYLKESKNRLAIPEIIVSMYVKCPVLAVDDLWTRSLADSGLVYFNRSSMSSLADAMKKIFADENLRRNLTEKNLNRTQQNNIPQVAKTLLNIINQS